MEWWGGMRQKSKNILLVSFDDAVAPWRYAKAFGEPLRLPNLEALCSVATAFHSAYAQAPICGPSRASMMTGDMPDVLGITDNSTFVFDKVPAESCWIHDLRQAGYFCSSGGKIHHMPTLRRGPHAVLYSDARKGFSSDARLPRELRKRSKAFGGHRNGRGALDYVDDDFFFDKQVADSTIQFLSTYAGDQPFYRELGFVSPHGPHITPARFKEMYDPTRLVRPVEWGGYLNDNAYVTANIPENEDFRDEDYWQKSIRNYFSSYTHGDHHLGRVLDALLQSPHAENTIVIVVADHGFHLGNRNLFRKTTLWEQSLHVPFVIFDPEDPQARQIDDPVALVDLGPTVLDFAGIPARSAWQGRSLRRMMAGARDPDRGIPSFYAGNVAIRKGNHRLIRYEDGSHQLFNVHEDYWQLHDLGIDHPMFAPMARALADVIHAA